MEHFASPTVPISWGELIDKITILEIKRIRLSRPDARVNVEKELALLSVIGARALASGDVAVLSRALRRVNEHLWELEDAIRKEEAKGRFGAVFIRLARSVYKCNDERAAIKRRINALLGSELVEEKSYAGGGTSGEDAVLAFMAAPARSGRRGELRRQKSPASCEKQDRSRTRTAGRN
jgi:hypothetical protein